jgi:hypothetical protein
MKGVYAVFPLLVWLGVAGFVYYANFTIGKRLKINKVAYRY